MSDVSIRKREGYAPYGAVLTVWEQARFRGETPSIRTLPDGEREGPPNAALSRAWQ